MYTIVKRNNKTPAMWRFEGQYQDSKQKWHTSHSCCADTEAVARLKMDAAIQRQVEMQYMELPRRIVHNALTRNDRLLEQGFSIVDGLTAQP